MSYSPVIQTSLRLHPPPVLQVRVLEIMAFVLLFQTQYLQVCEVGVHQFIKH